MSDRARNASLALARNFRGTPEGAVRFFFVYAVVMVMSGWQRSRWPCRSLSAFRPVLTHERRFPTRSPGRRAAAVHSRNNLGTRTRLAEIEQATRHLPIPALIRTHVLRDKPSMSAISAA